VIALVDGVIDTLATGAWRTSTTAEPCFPSTEAIITAVPAARPVTRPDAETLATVGVPDDHTMVRPISAVPAMFFGVAVS
jgi:hypothetical protein